MTVSWGSERSHRSSAAESYFVPPITASAALAGSLPRSTALAPPGGSGPVEGCEDATGTVEAGEGRMESVPKYPKVPGCKESGPGCSREEPSVGTHSDPGKAC